MSPRDELTQSAELQQMHEDFLTTLFMFGVQDKKAGIPARGYLLHGWQREEYTRGYTSSETPEQKRETENKQMRKTVDTSREPQPYYPYGEED